MAKVGTDREAFVGQEQHFRDMSELRASLETRMDTHHGQVMATLRHISDAQIEIVRQNAVAEERQRQTDRDVNALGEKVRVAIDKREQLEDSVEAHTADIKAIMLWKDDQRQLSASNISLRVAIISSIVGPVMIAIVAWLLSQIGITLIPSG